MIASLLFSRLPQPLSALSIQKKPFCFDSNKYLYVFAAPPSKEWNQITFERSIHLLSASVWKDRSSKRHERRPVLLSAIRGWIHVTSLLRSSCSVRHNSLFNSLYRSAFQLGSFKGNLSKTHTYSANDSKGRVRHAD